MILKIENKSKSRMRERDNDTNFNVENLQRDKKSWAYNRSKTSTMKNKN